VLCPSLGESSDVVIPLVVLQAEDAAIIDKLMAHQYIASKQQSRNYWESC